VNILNLKKKDNENQRTGAGLRRKNILEILMGEKVVEEAVKEKMN
jgi:hypothetical protein